MKKVNAEIILITLWLQVSVRCVLTNPVADLHLNCSILVLEKTSGLYSNSVYVLGNDHTDEFITELAKRSNRLVILSDKILNSPTAYHRITPAAYFIYSSNYTNFESAFSKLNTTHPNWQPLSKFIVLIRRIVPAEKDVMVDSVARMLYAVNVYSFVILISFDEKTVRIYTWFPFDEASQCGKFINAFKVNECTGDGFVNDANLFQQNVQNKRLLKRCVLRVGAFSWPPYTIQDESTIATRNSSRTRPVKFIDGYHVRTVQSLSHMYNLPVQYVTVDDGARWGTLLDNGTWTGGLGDLQSGRADIVIGGALQTPLRFNSFDCSPTYDSLFFKFYLPLPVKLPHWKNMINVFSPTFWITISTIYVGTSIFICILSRISRDFEKAYFTSYVNCFLTLWRIAIGHPADYIPTSKPVRAAFLAWLVYSFHITLVYTSSLLGFITTPTMHETIKNIKQLASSGLTLLVVPQFMQISNMMDEEFTTIISKKFDPRKLLDYSSAIDRLITERDVAIFDPEDHFLILAKERVSQAYSFDVIRFNPGIYVKKGSIYLRYLEMVQLIVRENGMSTKWHEDIIGASRYKKHQRVEYENEVLPLTLEELSGSFYVLIFGLSLAFVMFCLELIAFKFNAEMSKKNN